MPELILPPNAYNNCILRFQDRLLMSYRWHSRFDWRTELGIAELSPDLKPISTKPINVPAELKDNSQEDARCFLHQNSLWISWTVSQWPTQEHKSIVAYGKLIEEQDCWRITNHYIPAFGRNDFSSMEKNWVFFEK